MMLPLYQQLSQAEKARLRKKLTNVKLMGDMAEAVYNQQTPMTEEQIKLSEACNKRLLFLMELLA
jgi:hypothetical protein